MGEVVFEIQDCQTGARDSLFIESSADPRYQALLDWAATTPGLHSFIPDYHRCQLERWIWDRRDRLTGTVMDVGALEGGARRWLGPCYFTLGLPGAGCDTDGDLTKLPLADRSIDAIICTEVLEHCEAPWVAVKEMHRVLRPGGLLLVTSPFLWPDHHTVDYADLWRFTAQGWWHLLKGIAKFESVKLTRCEWTREGAFFYDMLRRFEGWGFSGFIEGTTGYLAEAVKGEA